MTDDGRRARSEKSRQLIIDALVGLVAGGCTHPTSQQIADAAGRTQRTLYCKFGSMGELFDEAIVSLPEGDPERQLLEMARRPNRTLTRLNELEARLALVRAEIDSALNWIATGADPATALAAVRDALVETTDTEGRTDRIGA